ncbi:MAG: TnpV protein [Oscillospiraceae bacterium]|nr:TnpV protein [Oscillospiraceae bacterium]
MELTYRMSGEYRVPNLTVPEETETALGKYALLRKRYLKENRRILFANLLTAGKLTEHLTETERTATERLEQIISRTAAAQGVTEDLKASDQMKWVGMMNNIKASAEETILDELIYT